MLVVLLAAWMVDLKVGWKEILTAGLWVAWWDLRLAGQKAASLAGMMAGLLVAW